MLSAKHAALAIRILILCLIASVSFFFAADKIPDTDFIRNSYEAVEESRDTVMKFSAATLSTSLAISALPDDFATPLAENLADMNGYFIAVLAILLLEKILILYGIKLAFEIVIPLACCVGVLFVILKKNILKDFAIRLCVFGLAAAFVVPCSTHITEYVAADLLGYVESTIDETEAGADKLNEAMDGGAEDKTIFERLSELFQTAVRDISDLLLHFQNTIRRCMNSIAILLLTNFIMPILTFWILRWILKETFNLVVVIPVPAVGGQNEKECNADKTESEFAGIGE